MLQISVKKYKDSSINNSLKLFNNNLMISESYNVNKLENIVKKFNNKNDNKIFKTIIILLNNLIIKYIENKEENSTETSKLSKLNDCILILVKFLNQNLNLLDKKSLYKLKNILQVLYKKYPYSVIMATIKYELLDQLCSKYCPTNCIKTKYSKKNIRFFN